MEKYIKVSAIEKMAQPMKALHGKDEPIEENHMGCKCTCCGKPCDTCSEADHESEDEYSEDEE